jgi:hypothetical protein
MTTDTFGIPLAYVIIVSLLLWTVIATRGTWWFKAAVILFCLLFSVVLWRSLEGLQGWPVEAAMPERFEVKWTLTEEPDKKGGRPGVIYVWARDLDPRASATTDFPRSLVRKVSGGEPRVYRLPYSRPLHEQAEEIREHIMGGGRFFASMTRTGLSATGERGGRRSRGRAGKAEGRMTGEDRGVGEDESATRYQDYVFHELPAPRFPEKSPDPSAGTAGPP